MIQSERRRGSSPEFDRTWPTGYTHGSARHRPVQVDRGNRALGVAAFTLAIWGVLIGFSLSAPLVGLALGALAGVVVGAIADRQTAAGWHRVRRSTEFAVVPVRVDRGPHRH